MDATWRTIVSSDRGVAANAGAPELVCEGVPIDDDEDDNDLAATQE